MLEALKTVLSAYNQHKDCLQQWQPTRPAAQLTLMNSFCTSHRGPHWSLLLLQNSQDTFSARGSTSFQSMTATTSLGSPSSLFSRFFRASPAVAVMKAAGMVMFRMYLHGKHGYVCVT